MTVAANAVLRTPLDGSIFSEESAAVAANVSPGKDTLPISATVSDPYMAEGVSRDATARFSSKAASEISQ